MACGRRCWRSAWRGTRASALESARTFAFSEAGHYSGDHCKNYPWKLAGYKDWYTVPKANSLASKISLYWSVSVGDYPHPRSYKYEDASGAQVPYPDSQSYVAILHQSIGSHNQWQTNNNPGPDYTKPRLFNGMPVAVPRNT